MLAMDAPPDVARARRQLLWVSRMLVAISVTWGVVGAVIVAWSVRHPPGVVLVAALVGNGLVWVVLATLQQRLLMRSFYREDVLLNLLRRRSAIDG